MVHVLWYGLYMNRTKHIQARLDDETYRDLQVWARGHNTSLTNAVNLAIRALTGSTKQESKPPESLMGLLANTDVMSEMERERTRELADEQQWR